ncbi:hypothetical protein PM082_022034 [Marasmius tenuissimus]|nr:hypothetical protein PM082_022034 [Marasmius tenuissimus]
MAEKPRTAETGCRKITRLPDVPSPPPSTHAHNPHHLTHSLPTPGSDGFTTPTTKPPSKNARTRRTNPEPTAFLSTSANNQPPPVQFDIFVQYIKQIRKKRKGKSGGAETVVEPVGSITTSTNVTWTAFLDEAAAALHTRTKFLETESFQWRQKTTGGNPKGNKMILKGPQDWSAMCRVMAQTSARSSKAVTLEMKPPSKTSPERKLRSQTWIMMKTVSQMAANRTKRGTATTAMDEKFEEILKTYPVGGCKNHPNIQCFKHKSTKMHFNVGFHTHGLTWSAQILEQSLPNITIDSIPLGSNLFSVDQAKCRSSQSKDNTTLPTTTVTTAQPLPNAHCPEPTATTASLSSPPNIHPPYTQGYLPPIHPPYVAPYNLFLVAPPPSMGYMPTSYPLQAMHPSGFAPQPMMAPLPFGDIPRASFTYLSGNFTSPALAMPPSLPPTQSHQSSPPPSPGCQAHPNHFLFRMTAQKLSFRFQRRAIPFYGDGTCDFFWLRRCSCPVSTFSTSFI